MSTASDSSGPRPWKRRTWRILGGIAVVAVVAMVVFASLAAQWTEWEAADRDQATTAFTAQRAQLGPALPYLDRDAEGRNFLHQELERPDTQRLSTLHALAWLAPQERLVHVRFPMWFVRAKDFGGNGLVLMLATVDRNLADLDLELDVAALERRGPGLLLDRELPNGTSLLLWSE